MGSEYGPVFGTGMQVLGSAEGCRSQVRQRDASPRFGTRLQIPGLAEGCSLWLSSPTAAARRGHQQAGECLPEQPRLSERSCCSRTRGDSQTGQVPLHRGGKASQEWPVCLGEGFSTHQVVFYRPEPPCHPLFVPKFLCRVCLCEPCDVFQMCLCVLPPGSSALAQALSFPFPITFLFLWQGVLPETFHFCEAWYCSLLFLFLALLFLFSCPG